ncbi:MAG: hypothetical protein K2F99_09125 [Muribaculaceae bacterium]|nr:hypothetical protein [Muribaculaceae bacterium]
MESYTPMQTIKRRMFAMRNGVVADALRKGGSPFPIIFGINLPQLVEIASSTGKNKELAEKLWGNTTTRESMLIAPMLMPVQEFGIEDARRWASGATVAEVADILCHRLLRHLPFAWALAEEYADSYIGLRLAFNLVASDPEHALRIAEAAIGNETLRPLAERLKEEAEYLG